MINRTQIIEEASKKAQEIVNKYSKGFTISDNLHAGKEAGHPMVGRLLGRSAAIGAMSKHDKNVSIGDVYTADNVKKDMKIGAAQGSIVGALYGGAVGGPTGAAIGATAGALAGTGIGAASPAAGYGLGKVFGSTKSPKK